jgi:Family of unknown function (DUF6158)
MREIEAILDEVYVGQERVTRDEIYRRIVNSDVSVEIADALNALPEGEYAQDEVVEALRQTSQIEAVPGSGVPAIELGDADLFRELGEVHRTRNATLRHGSDQALANHDDRMADLEAEYLRRYPDREVDPMRLREGARERTTDGWDPARAGKAHPRTGAEQPWDPEDLAVAEGHDPTKANIERARRELAQEGPAAVERTVP